MAIDIVLITHLYKNGGHKTSLDINMYMYSFSKHSCGDLQLLNFVFNERVRMYVS